MSLTLLSVLSSLGTSHAIGAHSVVCLSPSSPQVVYEFMFEQDPKEIYPPLYNITVLGYFRWDNPDDGDDTVPSPGSSDTSHSDSSGSGSEPGWPGDPETPNVFYNKQFMATQDEGNKNHFWLANKGHIVLSPYNYSYSVSANLSDGEFGVKAFSGCTAIKAEPGVIIRD